MADSPLKAKLSEIMKASMKSQDKSTLAFARNLFAAVRKKEIDDRKDIDDPGLMKIVQTLVKQRQDSIDQFKKGGRDDLVANEEAELKFLQSFLPAQMSDDELKRLVDEAVKSSGATSAKDMGAVMKILMPQVSGRADNKNLSEFVKARLS